MKKSMNHWDDENLLLRLYGADPSAHLSLSHFDECPECAQRWAILTSSRAQMLGAQPTAACSDDRLRAQRLSVWDRIERSSRPRAVRLIPAAATLCVLLLAVGLNRPVPQPAPQQVATAISDEEFFSEIASVVNDDTPRAVEPIRGLFSDTPRPEVQ